MSQEIFEYESQLQSIQKGLEEDFEDFMGQINDLNQTFVEQLSQFFQQKLLQTNNQVEETIQVTQEKVILENELDKNKKMTEEILSWLGQNKDLWRDSEEK